MAKGDVLTVSAVVVAGGFLAYTAAGGISVIVTTGGSSSGVADADLLANYGTGYHHVLENVVGFSDVKVLVTDPYAVAIENNNVADMTLGMAGVQLS